MSVEGWVENTDVTPIDLAKKFERIGVSAIIYTDINRDGMETGPNIDSTRETSPLRSDPNYTVINTDTMNIDEVVQHIINLIMTKR